jgi:hypothetical protein
VGLFDGERRQWRSQPAGPGVRRGLCFARPLVLGASLLPFSVGLNIELAVVI